MKKNNITKFPSGAIRDTSENKEDWIETIPWTALGGYAKWMTGKKAKYGEGNFKKGIPIESYEKSVVRHMHKYLANKYEGAGIEEQEDHVYSMIFNLLGIKFEQLRGNK